MFRKDLHRLLQGAPRSVADVAVELQIDPEEIEDDLRRVPGSVGHRGYRVKITGARCRHGGFTSDGDKLHKPGKYPRHRQTWINPPLTHIEGGEAP